MVGTTVIPVAASVAGAVVSTILPLLVTEVRSRIKDPEVIETLEYLEREMGSLIYGTVGGNHNRFKDRSEWREKVRELKNLLYDMEDCIDRFKIREISYTHLATRIKDLKASVLQKGEGLKQYIVQGHASSSGAQGQHLGGIPSHDHDNLVGIEEARLDLLALVRNSVKLEQKAPMVISVVGCGGIGKTCLAAKLYNDLGLCESCPNRASARATCKKQDDSKLCESCPSRASPRATGNNQDDSEFCKCFPHRAFVHATGKKQDDVLVEILRQLHKGCLGDDVSVPPYDADAKHLINGIRPHLVLPKRYFIVIDDVQEGQLADHVISEFRNEVTQVGGIIMLTTTVHTVAERCSSGYGHMYRLRPLSGEASGTLFSNEHSRRHPQRPPSKLELTGIHKECDGIPLALICMAQFWERDIDRCRTAWSKLCDQQEGDRLQRLERVLQHSYDSLPSIDLETCLLYFSMFPSEHAIKRASLMRRWLAEGAELGCGNYNNNHAAAIKNIKSLLDHNVIWPIQVSIDDHHVAKTCRPPRVMLGYISHMSRPEGFAIISSNEPCSAKSIRRLSLQTGDGSVLENEKAVCRLRTLVVSPEGRNSNNVVTAAAALTFDKCVLLRVLDLEAWHGPEKIDLNKKICKKLKLLKYLSLRGDNIIKDGVPKQMVELEFLETLDVGKENVVLVHVNVIKMRHLKHLIGKFQLMNAEYAILPHSRRPFKRSQLETLSGYVTERGLGFPRLMRHMSRLRKVKIFIHPDARAEKLTPPLTKAIADFIGKPLTLSAESERRSLSIDFDTCSPLLLDSPPSHSQCGLNIFSLKLRGTGTLEGLLPVFGANLASVIKLCLSWTTLVLKFSQTQPTFLDVLSKLEGLKYLKLVAQGDIVVGLDENPTASASPANQLVIKPGHLENLRTLCLMAQGSLPDITIQAKALEKLVSLHLICKDLHVSETVIQPLRDLKEVALCADIIPDKRDDWYKAAREHPNRPQVLLMEGPHRAG